MHLKSTIICYRRWARRVNMIERSELSSILRQISRSSGLESEWVPKLECNPQSITLPLLVTTHLTPLLSGDPDLTAQDLVRHHVEKHIHQPRT